MDAHFSLSPLLQREMSSFHPIDDVISLFSPPAFAQEETSSWPWPPQPLSPVLPPLALSGETLPPLFSPLSSSQAQPHAPRPFAPSRLTAPSISTASPLPSPFPSSDSDSSASAEWHPSAAAAAAASELPTAAAAGGRAKRSHREIDADRRRKEAAIIRRLEQLTEGESSFKRWRGGRDSRTELKREKLSILRSAADKIERLQAQLDRFEWEATMQRETAVIAAAEQRGRTHLQEVAQLKAESRSPLSRDRAYGSSVSAVQPLPYDVRDAMVYFDQRHALHSSLFLHSSVALLQFDIASGRLLDSNQ